MIEENKFIINDKNLLLDMEERFNIEPLAKRLNIAEIKSNFDNLKAGQSTKKLIWLMGFVGCFTELAKENYLYVFDDNGFLKVLVNKNISSINILKSGDLIGILGSLCRDSNGELVLKQQRILIISSENCLANIQNKAKKTILKKSTKTEISQKKSLNNEAFRASENNEIKIVSDENKNTIPKIPESFIIPPAPEGEQEVYKLLEKPIKIKEKKINSKTLIYALILANLFFLSGQAIFMTKVYSLTKQQKENFYNFANKYQKMSTEEIPLLNNQNTESKPNLQDYKNKINNRNSFHLKKIIKKKLVSKKIEKIKKANITEKIEKEIENKNSSNLANAASETKLEKEKVQLPNPEKTLFQPIQLPETKESDNQIKILGNEQDFNQYSQYQTQIIKPAKEMKTADIENLISKAKNSTKKKKSIYFFSDLIENSKNKTYNNHDSEMLENK